MGGFEARCLRCDYARFESLAEERAGQHFWIAQLRAARAEMAGDHDAALALAATLDTPGGVVATMVTQVHGGRTRVLFNAGAEDEARESLAAWSEAWTAAEQEIMGARIRGLAEIDEALPALADDALVGKWICPMHPEIVKDAPGKCDVCGMPLVSAESLGYVSADASEAQAPLVIPVSAPLRTGTRAVVYVAVPDKPGRYEGRQVTLGPRAGDVYIVYDGLQEGEIVVTNGAFKIDSAMQILARPSMMSPGGGSTPPSHHHGDAVEESPGG